MDKESDSSFKSVVARSIEPCQNCCEEGFFWRQDVSWYGRQKRQRMYKKRCEECLGKGFKLVLGGNCDE